MPRILANNCYVCKQNFAYCEIYNMRMEDIKEILSRNLAKLMAMSQDCQSQNALAKRSKVGQTTIGNYLNKDYKGYPNLGIITKLAHCFGFEAWVLIHPTMGSTEISQKEIQFYRKMKEELKKLQTQ